MDKKLKVGIIGAGAICRNHVQGFRGAGAEVAVVCDANPAALAKVQAELGIPAVVGDAAAIYADASLDAVAVCTPNFLHAEMTIKALDAGKHVLVEKPMALDPAQAEKMVAAATAAGRILMCGHNQRFEPLCQKVNDLRELGRLGEVYYSRCSIIRRRGIPGLGGWFTTRAMSGGGPLIDIGIHAIDRTWYMMGKPKPVAVSGATYRKFGNDIAGYVCEGMWAGPRKLDGIMDVEDFASALVRFDNGATMQVEVSWAVNREDEGLISTIMGDKAGARLDGNGLTLYGEQDGMITTQSVKFDKSVYQDRHQHFVECIVKGTPCTCPGEDGLAMQRVLHGIQASSDAGAELRI